jgi:hypothetical protein
MAIVGIRHVGLESIQQFDIVASKATGCIAGASARTSSCPQTLEREDART